LLHHVLAHRQQRGDLLRRDFDARDIAMMADAHDPEALCV